MSDYDRDVDPAGILQRRLGLSRRRFLGAAATTGVAAAAALSATAPSAAAAPAAAGNTVYGAARFADPEQREVHEASGINTIRVDLEHGELDEVPDAPRHDVRLARDEALAPPRRAQRRGHVPPRRRPRTSYSDESVACRPH